MNQGYLLLKDRVCAGVLRGNPRRFGALGLRSDRGLGSLRGGLRCARCAEVSLQRPGLLQLSPLLCSPLPLSCLLPPATMPCDVPE